jgi:hypothetical protein
MQATDHSLRNMTTSELIQLIFAGIVAISTVVYSILTWKLVSETRRMREFQITPDVNIYFERSEADASFIHIVFKNSGLGYAKNVQFEILKNFENYDSEIWDIKTKGVIKKGLDSFYSTQSVKYYFTDLSQNNKQKLEDYLIIRTSFEDLNSKKYSKDIKLSLNEFTGTGVMNPPDNYLGRISYELSELKKLFKAEFSKK